MKKTKDGEVIVFLDFNGTIDPYLDQLDKVEPKKAKNNVTPLFKGNTAPPPKKSATPSITGGKRLEFNHYTGRTEEYAGELREMVSMRLKMLGKGFTDSEIRAKFKKLKPLSELDKPKDLAIAGSKRMSEAELISPNETILDKAEAVKRTIKFRTMGITDANIRFTLYCQGFSDKDINSALGFSEAPVSESQLCLPGPDMETQAQRRLRALHKLRDASPDVRNKILSKLSPIDRAKVVTAMKTLPPAILIGPKKSAWDKFVEKASKGTSGANTFNQPRMYKHPDTYWKDEEEYVPKYYGPNKESIRLLKELCDKTGAKIVYTTTSRYDGWEKCANFIGLPKRYSLGGKYGVTPEIERPILKGWWADNPAMKCHNCGHKDDHTYTVKFTSDYDGYVPGKSYCSKYKCECCIYAHDPEPVVVKPVAKVEDEEDEMPGNTWKNRSKEIRKWFEEYKGVPIKNYVILDDDPIVNKELAKHWIPSIAQHGFMHEEYKQALKILGEKVLA